MKKHFRFLLGLTAALGLVLTCFFGSFKAVVFNRRFINRETARYGVADDVAMTQEAVDALFDETLRYLEHRRDDLVIPTVVRGEHREAYNDQEKQHMVDVLGLFDVGYGIYYTAVALVGLSLIWILLLKKEKRPDGLKSCARALLIGFAVFFLLAGVLGYLFYTDFDRYFVLFHEIFFDNDLWLMDPAKCLMINLMPEEFFFDIVMKFGTVFLAAVALMIAGALVYLTLSKRKKSS